jgi:hypothetical protein
MILAHYTNHGVHILKMSWFKIVDIDAYEDSKAVTENLRLQAALGVRELRSHQS